MVVEAGADVGEDVRGHVPPSLFYFSCIIYTTHAMLLQTYN